MILCLTTIELHIPACRSLKEKRKVVKGLVDRIHQRYRVSVLESEYHDLHQRAEIAVALLAQDERQLDPMLEALRRTVDEQGEALVTLWNDRILEAVD